ncbi:TolC family outer membrane protein [Acidocella sp.]|uniref:TolC family outer membrane protein n=1 Tax=Acidocella sp. TaxID=50710 RepID=UPI00262AFC42|nr:TolC family outer membrane protein [Acidocella sp.]MDD2795300.1 TolC family outer membrane protein [Acidocella sp.]
MRSMILAGLAMSAGMVLLPRAVWADGPQTLTQALSEAYDNNATLQAQRAALRATDEQVPAALAGWRPTVTVGATVGRLTGTEVLPNNTLQPNNGSTTITQNRSQLVGQVQVTQPIYSGGKVIDSTRQAKNSVYAARAQLLATEQTVFLDVVSAYVTVITDRQVLALDRSDQSVLAQQLKATVEQFNVGEITLTSVAQAQAALAAAKAQVEIADGNLQIAKENFRKLVGDYPAQTLVPPQPLALPVSSKEQAAKAALANNPNVIAAEFNDAASKDAVDVAFSALLPQLSVQASAYSQQGAAGPNTRLTGGSVLGQLTVPLYQGGAEYSGIRQARAKEQQAFAGILDAQRTAYAQATQAWEGLVASRDAIMSTNAEIKANAIALDGTEREDLVGTRTTLDVLNAQQLLLNSQVQQVQNISTLVNNSYTVAAAIGRLTATDLGLPVDQYNDLKYYKSVEYAGFGTGERADQKAGIAPDGSLLNAGTAPVIADEPPGSSAP